MSATAFQGSLLIVVAPSGAGKTSLVRHLLGVRDGLRLPVSYTTRAQRPGERDGVDYRFVSPEQFERRRGQGEFLEWALVHGNHYATSRDWTAAQMAARIDIVLESTGRAPSRSAGCSRTRCRCSSRRRRSRCCARGRYVREQVLNLE